MASGTMTYKDKSIAVRDVSQQPRIDAEGVRDGWYATTDDILAARMFYPTDMFTFDPRNEEEDVD